MFCKALLQVTDMNQIHHRLKFQILCLFFEVHGIHCWIYDEDGFTLLDL